MQTWQLSRLSVFFRQLSQPYLLDIKGPQCFSVINKETKSPSKSWGDVILSVGDKIRYEEETAKETSFAFCSLIDYLT